MVAKQKGLDEHERDFYVAFRRNHPAVWLGTLIGPPALTVAIVVLIGVFISAEYCGRLIAISLVTFFGLGKFAIVVPNEWMSKEALFVMVLYMDLLVAVLLVCHAGFLFRIPILGPKLLALTEDGQVMLRRFPWMRRVTFFGIIAFVMFPLAATGSVGGALFGRLLGMSRIATLMGIVIGSMLGCGVMYFKAGLVQQYFDPKNPWTTGGGIAFIIVIVIVLNMRYRKMKRRMLEEMASDSTE
jgi:uncharacterized membrane protein